MKARIRKILRWLADPTGRIAAAQFRAEAAAQRERENAIKTAIALQQAERDEEGRREYMERIAELAEARAMAGTGPWGPVGPGALARTDAILEAAYKNYGNPVALRETVTAINAGAFGDLELALQNVNWRREVQISWLEFSRWGIQQIMLIMRLNYIKNPIIRRLVDVCAAYVFARGVEISSPDEEVNKIIDSFIKRNAKVLGHRALMKLERAKDYDGNLFFVFFDDAVNEGTCNVRTIDATEIDEIKTDPDDVDTPWFYLRASTQTAFDPGTAQSKQVPIKAWYPALGYEPDEKPATMNEVEVKWDNPVYHVRCGDIGKWTFGCPRGYPAVDWAREARKYLEACAADAQAKAQIARTITAKGGQQALSGIKNQISTTVGPSNPILDTNPPAVAGSTMIMGPGGKMELMKQRGTGPDPNDVRRFFQMCVMVWGVPLTFLGDTMDGSMATAVSLDRPTETIMLEKQEAWQEDLIVIVTHFLEVSMKATKGALRECMSRRGIEKVTIRECLKVPAPSGNRMQYAKIEARGSGKTLQILEAKKPVKDTEVLVKVSFPSIREGDLKTLVDATVESMTLANRAGQITGIDERAGVHRLFTLQDYEEADELTEQMYPKGDYEPNRAKQVLAAPIGKPMPLPGGTPELQAQQDAQQSQPHDTGQGVKESLRPRVRRLMKLVGIEEARNGHAQHART